MADFVDRYMPAYDTYLPALYSKGPQRGTARPELLQPADSASFALLVDEPCPVLKVRECAVVLSKGMCW